MRCVKPSGSTVPYLVTRFSKSANASGEQSEGERAKSAAYENEKALFGFYSSVRLLFGFTHITSCHPATGWAMYAATRRRGRTHFLISRAEHTIQPLVASRSTATKSAASIRPSALTRFLPTPQTPTQQLAPRAL